MDMQEKLWNYLTENVRVGCDINMLWVKIADKVFVNGNEGSEYHVDYCVNALMIDCMETFWHNDNLSDWPTVKVVDGQVELHFQVDSVQTRITHGNTCGMFSGLNADNDNIAAVTTNQWKWMDVKRYDAKHTTSEYCVVTHGHDNFDKEALVGLYNYLK